MVKPFLFKKKSKSWSNHFQSNCQKRANFERFCSGVPLLYFSPAGCSPCLNQPLGKCRIQNTIPHYQIYNSLVFVSQMCFFFRPDGQDSSMGEGDKKVQLERVNNKSLFFNPNCCTNKQGDFVHVGGLWHRIMKEIMCFWNGSLSYQTLQQEGSERVCGVERPRRVVRGYHQFNGELIQVHASNQITYQGHAGRDNDNFADARAWRFGVCGGFWQSSNRIQHRGFSELSRNEMYSK